MKRSVFLTCVIGVTLAAPFAGAQFLGDALASAGLNVTEYQAGEMIAASGGINDPSLRTVPSGAPQAATTTTPERVGTDVGVSRPATPSGTTAPATPSSSSTDTSPSWTPAPSSAPMSGGATAFSGVAAHQAAIDPKAAAAWRDAFRPVGTKLPKPPEGAITLGFGGVSYSYAKGMFLRQADGGWQVVAAPVGAVIGEKPVGAATAFAGGKPFAYYAGTFYAYDAEMKGYAVVAPPVGATVDYLPDTAAKVQWNGAAHYSYAGTYYKPFYRGSSLVYTVAGS